MTKKPTIAFFMLSAGTMYGGSETYVLTAAQGLADEFAVKLIVGRGPHTDDFKSLTGSCDVECLEVPFVPRTSRAASVLVKSGLHRKLNRYEIEILSTFFSLPAIKRFLRDADLLEVQYAPDSILFPFVDNSIKKIVHFHGVGLTALYNFFRRRLEPRTDRFVACSRWCKNRMQEEEHIQNIEVIYNAVDTGLFRPGANRSGALPAAIRPEIFTIGTVGRLSRAKGIDVLYQAVKHLAGSTACIAAGPPDMGFAAQLERYCSSDFFHAPGPLSNKDMPGFYNGLDCFVLASRAETFPVTLLEAMSCGVPVVASRVGGIPEVVDDGRNGILVPPQDPAALADALRTLMRNKEKRTAMGTEARKTVRRSFSHERLSRELKQFYYTVLNAG